MDSEKLALSGLCVGYDNDILRDITLSVLPGKIVTIIGPNGSGKSTLLKTVTGELCKRAGVISLNGKDKDGMSIKEIAESVSMVATAPIRPELMTCREVIESGRYPYTGRFGRLSFEDKEKVREAMDLTETVSIAESYFTDISDGQRQRVLLARSICQEPEVLVLDEPTSFLDIRYRIDILDKIRHIAKDKNTAILMSLHEPELAMKLSDTVVAVGLGRVLRIGTPKEAFTESFIRDLYGLGSMSTDLLGSRPWFDDVKKSEYGSCKRSEECKHTPGVIMIAGTMSNVGKSIIAAGLCRIFAQDGLRVAPFKSQNMANNSFVTDEGLEMGRAQVMQAMCAGIAPDVRMNPILLKPVSDGTSQVIVKGVPVGNMKASEYFEYKKQLKDVVMDCFTSLKDEVDVIVIEGAGSCAEINLKDGDIVNTGLAEMTGASVLLAGDIDRGGVFAQLLGTLDLLEDHERERIKGLIINRFRGDKSLLEPGLVQLEEMGGVKVTGVIPYAKLDLDDEDSLSDRLCSRAVKSFDIAVIHLPHIANFTDLDAFSQVSDVSVRFVSSPQEIGDADMIIIPGTKNTIGDMKWMNDSGIGDAIKKASENNVVIIGICGGFQMLGEAIEDDEALEEGGSINALALLPIRTKITPEKTRKLYEGDFSHPSGVLNGLTGKSVRGYEIHMGRTECIRDLDEFTSGGTGYCLGNVYGTYVHGLFDTKESAKGIVDAVSAANKKKIDTSPVRDLAEYREEQYDRLAKLLRQNLDMNAIYEMIK